MKTKIQDPSAKFLLDASVLYRETCPELSRHLMQFHVNVLGSEAQKISSWSHNSLVCQCCYQWLRPDNHRVRLRPKRRPSLQLQRLLRRRATGRRLSLLQKNLLRRFQKSSTVLMATCHTCNKTSRHKGMNRDFMGTLAKTHSTPGSAGKHKTPQSACRSSASTPKSTPGKDKTPVHTPRSSTATNTSGSGSGSSASKSVTKTKNWVVQRLSKILMREDSKGGKKGGLKDFLSSL